MLLEIINNYQMNSKSDILNIMNYNDFCYFLFKHQNDCINLYLLFFYIYFYIFNKYKIFLFFGNINNTKNIYIKVM